MRAVVVLLSRLRRECPVITTMLPARLKLHCRYGMGRRASMKSASAPANSGDTTRRMSDRSIPTAKSAGTAIVAIHREVFEKIVDINESGTAILMVEQNARRALRESDRGVVLDQGENRFEGTAESLLDSDEVAELYLGTQ